MYEELRKKAEQKVQAKMAFFICAVTFFFTTILLLTLSYYLPAVAFWLRLPIPVFMLVLGILYLAAFGLPTADGMSENWREEEVEKEMLKLYRQRRTKLPPVEELSETEILELRQLEELKEKWERTDDYV